MSLLKAEYVILRMPLSVSSMANFSNVHLDHPNQLPSCRPGYYRNYYLLCIYVWNSSFLSDDANICHEAGMLFRCRMPDYIDDVLPYISRNLRVHDREEVVDLQR